MGSFYRTSEPQRLDFMYDLPENVMMKAVENADTNIDQAQNTLSLAGNVVKINHLDNPIDTKIATDWTNSWNKQIDAKSQDINNDPASWRKHISDIRDMSRQIQNDMSTGAPAKVQANLQAKTAGYKNLDEQVALNMKNSDQGITPAMASAYKAAGEYAYKGAVNLDGTYNDYVVPQPTKYVNAGKRLDDALNGMKGDKYDVSKDRDTGAYIITDKQSGVQLTSSQVADVGLKYMLGDDELMNYYKHGSTYGFTKSLHDDNGEFIRPYETDDKGNVKFDLRSPLAAPLAYITGKLDFKDASSSSSASVNPYTMLDVKHKNDQSDAALARTQKEADDAAAEKSKRDAEDRKRAWEWATDPVNRNKDGSLKPMPKELVPDSLPSPLVSKQFSLNRKATNEVNDLSSTANDDLGVEILTKNRDAALKAGNMDGVISLNAQIYNKSQDINKSRDAANAALLKEGYTQDDINKYNSYMVDKPKIDAAIKAEINNSGVSNGIFAPSGADQKWTMPQSSSILNPYIPTNPKFVSKYGVVLSPKKVNEYYSAMAKVSRTAKDDYYTTANQKKEDIAGLVLDGPEGEVVKSQVNRLIKTSPSSVTFINPATGEAVPGLKADADFDKKYDVVSAISNKDIGFKVVDKASKKEYLATIAGNNNLAHTINDAYKDKKDVPGVDRILKDFNNTQVSSIKYETNFMKPGDSKIVLVAGNNVKVVMQANGNYTAYDWKGNPIVIADPNNVTNDPKDPRFKTVKLLNTDRNGLADGLTGATFVKRN